jgi:uncharacterized phage infection (PIP) family protein YhgE
MKQNTTRLNDTVAERAAMHMEEKANGSRKMKKLKKMPIKPAEIFAKGFAETKNGSAEIAKGSEETKNGSAEIAKGSAKTANGSEETKNGSAKTANGSTETKNGF